jgi:hypothetical protein
MSLLSDLNPINLIDKGVKKVEEAGGSLINAVVDTGKAALNMATSTSIDFNNLGGTFKAIGAALTHPIATVSNLISSGEAKTIVSNISMIADLMNPLGPGIALTQVAANKWISQDNHFSYEKVEKLDEGDDLAEYWAEYDKEVNKSRADKAAAPKEEPKHLDFNSRDIYTARPAAEQQPEVARAADTTATGDAKSRSYINANGEHAEVSVKPGEVDYKSEKDGKVVTEGGQTAGQSWLSHDGEKAILNTKLGKLELTSDQIKVLQSKDQAQVTLPHGEQLVRHGSNIDLLDTAGKLLQTLDQNSLHIAGDVQMFASTAEMNAASAVASGCRTAGDSAQPDAPGCNDGSWIKVRVATDGTALASLGDGTKIEMRNDKTALIKTAGGKVFLVSGNHTFFWKDGQFVDIEGDQNAAGAYIDGDGDVNTGGVKVRHDGAIQFAQGVIDLRHLIMKYKNDFNQERTVKLNENKTAGVEVHTDAGETVKGKGQVATTVTRTGEVVTSNLQEHTIGTVLGTVSSHDIRLHHQGKPDTIIKSDNTVLFEGGNGPILYGKGGIKFDDQTSVDQWGHVKSGDWNASSGIDGRGMTFFGPSPVSPELAANARETATNAVNNAMDVYGKASSGIVTFADINVLNQNVADICSLMGALAAAGNSSLCGQLQSSLAFLSQAISFATPKAQAAQIAMDRGESSPFIIKAIEDGTYPKLHVDDRLFRQKL